MTRALFEDLFAGKYRLLSVLAVGGMAVVHRAEQLDSEGVALRHVALKMVKPEFLATPGFAERFLREVRISMRLRGSHIVTTYDAGKSDTNLLYFTMELLEGTTLLHVLKREGKLLPPRAMNIAAQICEALSEAHGQSRPIVHRDLKPANVFVEQWKGEDWIKVADFGIAKVHDGTDQITQAGVVLGTPSYMAPEQWTGEETDARSDLYAIGVMLFEMLTGARPFSGSPEVLMQKHLRQPPPPLPESIPSALRQLVGSLLEKDPFRRPRDASTVRQALLTASAVQRPRAKPRVLGRAQETARDNGRPAVTLEAKKSTPHPHDERTLRWTSIASNLALTLFASMAFLGGAAPYSLSWSQVALYAAVATCALLNVSVGITRPRIDSSRALKRFVLTLDASLLLALAALIAGTTAYATFAGEWTTQIIAAILFFAVTGVSTSLSIVLLRR